MRGGRGGSAGRFVAAGWDRCVQGIANTHACMGERIYLVDAPE